MSPLASWLLLLGLIAAVVLIVLPVCRRAERRHVSFCTCGRCMAASTTWHPSRNANDPVRLDSNRVVASRPDGRFRL